jgi:hypothetical protein
MVEWKTVGSKWKAEIEEHLKKDGMDWRCGECGTKYSTAELLKLDKIPAVGSDEEPEHGFISRCKCGYVFHQDKWFLTDVFQITRMDKPIALIRLSTVDLELNHFGNYYETMVFVDESYGKEVTIYYEHRYKTKAEAIEGHNLILDRLLKGDYNIVDADGKIEVVMV